jgi:hypothetical protein
MTRIESCTVELNVVRPATSIENLNADFAFHEARGVHAHDGQHPFDNLPANDCWFRKATTHDKHVAAKTLLPEDVFSIANEVPTLVST